MDYKLIVVCLVVLCTTPANGWWWDWSGREWSDSAPSDCPGEDPQTNVCGALKELNTTCITFGCCSDTESDVCNWCISIYACSSYKCYVRCCDGYERDMMGRCRNATGEIECENGGSRSGDWCQCPHGFEGKGCEIPVCKCMNGGECIVKDSRPYCNCPSDYYGKSCEYAKCSSECQNGGTCYKYGDYEVCRCPEQFVGKRCELPVISSKTCPALEYSNDFCEPTSQCTNDGGCWGDEVCCYDGCSYMCQTPVRDQCQYEGRVFWIGQTHKKDGCTKCTCTHDGWRCYSQSCERRMNCPEGRQPERKPGECCPTCPDEPQSKPLIIHNGPVTTVYAYTTQFSDYADMKSNHLGIYAVDGNGDKLRTTSISADNFTSITEGDPPSSTEYMPTKPKDLDINLTSHDNLATISWNSPKGGRQYVRYFLLKIEEISDFSLQHEYILVHVRGLKNAKLKCDYKLRNGSEKLTSTVWAFGPIKITESGHMTADVDKYSKSNTVSKTTNMEFRQRRIEANNCICSDLLLHTRAFPSCMTFNIKSETLRNGMKIKIQLMKTSNTVDVDILEREVTVTMNRNYQGNFKIHTTGDYYIRVHRLCNTHYHVNCGKTKAVVMRSERIFILSSDSSGKRQSCSIQLDL